MQCKWQFKCECWIRWKIYGSSQTLQHFPEVTVRKTTKCFYQVKWTVGPDLNLGYSEYGNC